MANLIATSMHASGALTIALGSAISCVQIFYVTNFEYIFSLDPKITGRRIIYALGAMIILPDALVGIYSTIHHLHVDYNIKLLTHEFHERGISFLTNYSVFWTLLFFILSVLAFVCIPLLLKMKKPNQSNNIQPQKIISIKRFLFTTIGLFFFSGAFLYICRQK
jgi:nitric oxide reductase large subunit